MRTNQEFINAHLHQLDNSMTNTIEVYELINDVKIEAYNQAIEDAAENAKYKWVEESDGKLNIIIDKQSIIKLKKPISGAD